MPFWRNKRYITANFVQFPYTNAKNVQFPYTNAKILHPPRYPGTCPRNLSP